MKFYKILFPILIVIIYSCNTVPKTEEGYIDKEGVSLYYKTIGNGEPIFFLHGGPGLHHQYFTPYIDKLSNNYKVVYYDQRGSGLSTSPIDSISININTFIDDIETIRKYLGIEKINLAGHSWGGILAKYYAFRYPQNLKSLILFNTAGSTEMFIKFSQNLIKNRDSNDTAILDSLGELDSFKNRDPKAVEEFYNIFFKAYFKNDSLSPELNMNINDNTAKNGILVNNLIFSSIWPFDLYDSLNVIDCPTLILHGLYDPIPVEAAELTRDNISNSELVLFENSGHWPFLEEEDKFISVITDFMKRNN